MGIFGKSAKRAKEFAKQQNRAAAAEIETVEAEKARTIAAEKARMNIFGMLGQPGTYGTPGTPGAPESTPGTGSYYQPGETFGEAGSPLAMAQFEGGGYTPGMASWKSRAGILDPEKYAEEVGKTSAFRQASQRMAEAEQLVNREGPMWDELENSTYGVIAEGVGRQYRDEIRELKNRAASGSKTGARNLAREEASFLMAQEKKNQQRTKMTFDANLQLFDLVRKNQADAMDMSYKLVDNLPEMRAAYSNTMSSLAELMSTVALPVSSAMKEKGYLERMAHPTVTVGQRIMGSIVGAAQGFLTGAKAGGLWGGVAGAAAGATVGAAPELGGEQGKAAGPIGYGQAAGAFGGALGAGIFGTRDQKTTSTPNSGWNITR